MELLTITITLYLEMTIVIMDTWYRIIDYNRSLLPITLYPEIAIRITFIINWLQSITIIDCDYPITRLPDFSIISKDDDADWCFTAMFVHTVG